MLCFTGKYAMRDLVQKLPTGNASQDQATSDETISAVLATLNEVIKKNAEFSRSLLEAEGVPRLINLARPRQGLNRSARVAKFASQVLIAMWSHQELRDVYRKNGFKETDFVARGTAVPSSPPPGGVHSSTLNRPMASQGGTRYEDKTLSLQRGTQRNQDGQYRDVVPLADIQYGDKTGHTGPPVGGVRILPPGMVATCACWRTDCGIVKQQYTRAF
ncbi:catenin delta-2-like [Artemia franciscana]|uniref:catenin delta-2-like n=1 Tax=Artemia franciscana TaxID=6661 RepID=UPI0032DA398E